jgi:uncharacterized protein
MIVDCHTHMWRAEHWGEEITVESTRALGRAVDLNVNWEDHERAMQQVDKAIVFGLWARHVGLVVPNDYIAAYVATNARKLIGFASIDPNEIGYLDELHHAVEDLGLKGVKLGPIYQNYHPMDERVLPIYEYCERNHLPIIIHQGATFPRRAPLKFAFPIQLEEVALSYPDLVMVIAHLGHPWIAETVVLIRKHPNLYADLSALHYRPWQFYNAMMLALEYGVMDKILFGSDYPFTTPEATLQALYDINEIPGRSGLPEIPIEKVRMIIHRDTLALLKIGTA